MSDLADPIRLSVLVGLGATAAAAVPATALGWLLARRQFPGKAILSTLMFAPMVLPPVVVGLVLLRWLGRGSLLGGVLADWGLAIPFTAVGAALASLVVSFPFFVVAARSAFEAVDRRYEEVSQAMGLGPGRTFIRVTLPLAAPGLLAGAVLSFARALGEFGATVVVAGNIEGRTRTISLAIYALLESPHGEALVWKLAGASIAIALGALALYEALNRWQRRRLT